MAITVQIPSPLRRFTNNQAQVYISAGNINELLDGLEEAHNGIKETIIDENGYIRRYVNIYLNDEDIRFLDVTDTILNDGDEVAIVPAIAGGDGVSESVVFDQISLNTLTPSIWIPVGPEKR